MIIPSSNTTVEAEFNNILSGYASLHVGRIRLRNVNVGELDRFADDVSAEAEKLSDAGIDVLGLACTSGSFVRGSRQYEELERLMTEISSVPSISTSGAVLRSLKQLGCRRIALVTPYTQDVTKLEERLLTDNGFEVVSTRYASIVDNLVIGRVREEEVSRMVLESGWRDADCVFISCTNLRTFGILHALENELGIPVISSNSATLWDMARRAGLKSFRPVLGRLFTMI